MLVCSIISANYLPHARSLALSVAANGVAERCTLLGIDSFDEPIATDDPQLQVVTPEQIGVTPSQFDRMRGNYELLELATALKPWLLRWLVAQDGADDGVIYFDPDIVVFSPLPELAAALQAAEIVVTPHLTAPLPRDGRHPSEADIQLAGMFNLGFIAVRPGLESERILAWWQERLLDDCRIDPAHGVFVDQRWMDWLPSLTDAYAPLRHPGYNVAYWNLPTRELELAAGEQFTVDGQPLRFFHFSGYSPDAPHELSRHQDRIAVVPGSPLALILQLQRERLRDFASGEPEPSPRALDLPASGRPLGPLASRLHAEQVTAGTLTSSIHSRAGEQAFLRWLGSPPAPGEVPPLLELIWSERADLQAAFPPGDPATAAALVAWGEDHGPSEVPILARVAAARGIQRSVPPRIVLLGDVGGEQFHVGDEAMFAANRALLAEAFGEDAVVELGREADAEAIAAAVAGATGVMVSGGGNICDRWPELTEQRIVLFEQAAAWGIPVVTGGQTLGPELSGPQATRLAAALASADQVGIRDAPSMQLALDLGLRPSQLVAQIDDAFALPADAPTDTALQVATAEPYVAVSLDASFAQPEQLASVRGLAGQLIAFAGGHGLSVVIVPHLGTLGERGGPDVEAARQLQGYLDQGPVASHIAPVPTPGEAVWLSAHAELVVSSRYHPVVFAAAGATPCIGLPRTGDAYTTAKITAALEKVGAEAWAIDHERAACGELLPALEALYAARGQTAAQMREARTQLDAAERERRQTLIDALSGASPAAAR